MISLKIRLTALGIGAGLATGLGLLLAYYLIGELIYPMMAGAAIGLLVATLLSYFALGFLSRSIQGLINYSDKIVAGDLTLSSKDFKTTGEFNKLGLNLERICKGMLAYFTRSRDNIEILDRSGDTILAGTEKISEGAQEQANQIQKLLSSVEEFATAARHAAKEAEDAAEVAANTEQAAQLGGEILEKVVEGMNVIHQRINELGDKSNEIGQIILVIEDIAAQTNLLALNAAIEAARAGEYGRGFAVVAEEVRGLAERSSNATKEISLLINNIQDGINDAVEVVQSGIETTGEAGDSFKAIQEQVAETVVTIRDVTDSARNQVVTSENLVEGAQAIAAVSEEAAASTEETTAVVQELPVLSEKIRHTISVFGVK
ncbi:MAG: methyl-accepting chemotaxis protein [Firmicutes bacterium]|nr:methyl-accepting chemotaxis protein [Bacillota bacterium]